MTEQGGKYPSTIFRVSLKAMIRNDKNEVLLVQEGDFAWTFPGGGLEHGESEAETLKRELYEEVLLEGGFTARPMGIETIYVPKYETWLLWIMYDVACEPGYTFGVGQDANDAKFLDPHAFKESDNEWERLIYKWAVEKSPR